MDFSNLKVDKENTSVRYNDELHKYWTKESGEACISATTLIHKFTTFDEDFWSAYKTLEKLTTQDDFSKMKIELLKDKKFDDGYLLQSNIAKEFFESERQKLLAEWDEKREVSCVRGTAIHKEKELQNLAGKSKELSSLKLGGSFPTIITNNIVGGQKGVYPELLLSRISADGQLRIAGQADLVIVDDWDVYILDYKTGKTMDLKSYFDPRRRKYVMMKYPLNNIMDCNFLHYTLQLSLYAWMIQKIDERFNIKLLMLIHYDHNGGVAYYECEYKKTDVERMLAFHKAQVAHEKFNRSIQKIEWA